MNFAARHLLPLLTIDLTEGGEAGGSGGGDGGAGGAGGEGADGKAASSGDGKGDSSSGDAAAAAAAAAKGGAAGDDAKAAEAAKAATAELTKSYEKWEPKLPKGIPFDAKGFGDFRQAFIEAGLKPEQSQKLVDVFAKAELGRLQKVAAELQKESAGWADSLKSDMELAGKNGEKLDATTKAATRAMQKLATPAFRALLKSSGLQSHPEMIRIMARAGAGMAEDSTGSSKAAGKGAEKSPAEKAKSRWPNSPELHTP